MLMITRGAPSDSGANQAEALSFLLPLQKTGRRPEPCPSSTIRSAGSAIARIVAATFSFVAPRDLISIPGMRWPIWASPLAVRPSMCEDARAQVIRHARHHSCFSTRGPESPLVETASNVMAFVTPKCRFG